MASVSMQLEASCVPTPSMKTTQWSLKKLPWTWLLSRAEGWDEMPGVDLGLARALLN